MSEAQLRDGSFHELDELLDSIEDSPTSTLQEADNAFLERVRSEVACKSGRLRNAIKYYEMQATDAAKIAQQAKARVERIKAYTLAEMAAASIKEIKAPWGYLRRQNNGGVEPLVIDDAAQVPPQHKRVTLTMPLLVWTAINLAVTAAEREQIKLSEPEIVNDSVRLSLLKSCAECAGKGEAADYVGLEMRCVGVECPSCGGDGKGQVPGAHLGERGEHLRVG